jgi:DNA-binding transcriptional LysR family regulator
VELRHLRYFVAAAKERNITVAATRRLRTAQPSLSRQLREVETEVGGKLMTRSASGIELTAAGRTFLDHARLAAQRKKRAVGEDGPRNCTWSGDQPPRGTKVRFTYVPDFHIDTLKPMSRYLY